MNPTPVRLLVAILVLPLVVVAGASRAGPQWSPESQGAHPGLQIILAANEGGGGSVDPALCPNIVYGMTCSWFNGGEVVFSPARPALDPTGSGGSMEQANVNSGSWRCLSGNQIELRWQHGGFVDTLQLSPINREQISIWGHNQNGTEVSGSCATAWAGESDNRPTCELDRRDLGADWCQAWLEQSGQDRVFHIWPADGPRPQVDPRWMALTPATQVYCGVLVSHAKEQCGMRSGF